MNYKKTLVTIIATTLCFLLFLSFTASAAWDGNEAPAGGGGRLCGSCHYAG